ncbi:hypothetical protein AZE42_13555 [Rhizopogon vesiculosus]|uniref:Myb/SANT-like domain-containing protein n=1 Tax=Rhizopogon vesiculosus TaxID=180088 RepID=A0A1J8QZX3_9AGAM|nr:hypothetical protein AZE42_13555 [Rhizopogon vesiculosus]
MAEDNDESSKETKENASWNDVEVNAFLDYLITQRSKIAGITFKNSTFAEAAVKIAGLKTSGAVKAMIHCKRKYGDLKSKYNAIDGYTRLSGRHWDNNRGAAIQGDTDETAWTQFLANAPKGSAVMKQFKNCGWKFYDKMDQILPSGSNAHGAAAYNPASLAADILVDDAGTSNTAADDNFGWGQCASALPVTSPTPVAGSSSESTMSIDASLSLTSSTGKRSFSEMVTSHSAPPPIHHL